jgi:hypothetical protein
MKRYLLLMGLVITLGGCAFGVYDDGGYFQGAAIGVYPYYAPSHPYRAYGGNFHRHGYRYYSHGPYRYYRGPGYHGYYR